MALFALVWIQLQREYLDLGAVHRVPVGHLASGRGTCMVFCMAISVEVSMVPLSVLRFTTSICGVDPAYQKRSVLHF